MLPRNYSITLLSISPETSGGDNQRAVYAIIAFNQRPTSHRVDGCLIQVTTTGSKHDY
jgi:hypothetical protein